MTVNQNVQAQAAVRGRRMRRHQRLVLVSGFVVTAIVGLLALSTFLYFTRAGTERPAQIDVLVDEQATLREQLGVTVAPVNQSQIDALMREQAALREQLSVMVAPVNPAQIDALVPEQTALGEQLGVAVAPVGQGQLDALVREHARRERFGISVAPVNQAQIDALVREHGGQGQ